MAGLNVQVTSGESAITSTAKTIFTLTAAANQRIKILGLTGDGKGTSNTDSPVKIELMTYASISGGTAGSVTSSKMDGDMGETIQTTIAGNYTAEPTYTTGVTIRTYEFHPQTRNAEYFPNFLTINIKGGTGFAIRVTSVQNETMAFNLFFEE